MARSLPHRRVDLPSEACSDRSVASAARHRPKVWASRLRETRRVKKIGGNQSDVRCSLNTRLASVSARALDRGASIRIETLADLIATVETHGKYQHFSANSERD
jgi:hypothetical protein